MRWLRASAGRHHHGVLLRWSRNHWNLQALSGVSLINACNSHWGGATAWPASALYRVLSDPLSDVDPAYSLGHVLPAYCYTRCWCECSAAAAGGTAHPAVLCLPCATTLPASVVVHSWHAVLIDTTLLICHLSMCAVVQLRPQPAVQRVRASSESSVCH